MNTRRLFVQLNLALPSFVGACAAIGVLMPPPAEALDFGFKFNHRFVFTQGTFQPDGTSYLEWVTPEGLARPVGNYEIEGKILNLDNNVSGQAPATIVVTKSLFDPVSLGVYEFVRGSGFDLAGGGIQRSVWIGELNSLDTVRRLVFSATPLHLRGRIDSGLLNGFYDYDEDGNLVYTCACTINVTYPEGSPALFYPLQPATSVPGPLPILAAAAAYRISRSLKRRIQKTRPIA